VGSGHVEVVRLDRNRANESDHVALPSLAPTTIGELDAHQQLRRGYRRHGDVVLLGDHLVEGRAVPLGVDQDRRIDDQPLRGPVLTGKERVLKANGS